MSYLKKAQKLDKKFDGAKRTSRGQLTSKTARSLYSEALEYCDKMKGHGNDQVRSIIKEMKNVCKEFGKHIGENHSDIYAEELEFAGKYQKMLNRVIGLFLLLKEIKSLRVQFRDLKEA
eukprot:TRINITY_DN6737_c0_g1_i2.p1 TRINITY_DN6737_c0_g1~~TRINITY_DN6737_c0_g1_i2.p1  ORF type:complete len:130 (-),score=26.46 TRINITY_DN6737_c0_g1_i2:125-481(-)